MPALAGPQEDDVTRIPAQSESPSRGAKSALERYRRLRSSLVDGPLGRWWTRTASPGAADWAILGAILLVASASFLYGDVRATFEHSFNFLDSVFTGRIRDFYTISIEHTSTTHPAVYDIPIYAIFGVWNLPTYLIHKATGFDYMNSTPAELWLKAMIVLFALVAARLIADVAHRLGASREQSKWAVFFFLTSYSVFVPVFVVVQYDIILVVVVLLAMRGYVEGNMRAFIGWFVLANTLKLFAIFIFIPLLVLREKRLRVVFGQFVLGLLGLVACRLIYLGDAGHKAATGGFMETMLPRLTNTTIPLFSADFHLNVPLFLVALFSLTIFAYAKTTHSKNELNAFAVYLAFAAFLAFVVLVPLNPYWIILIAPFSTLLVFLQPKHLLLNTVMEMGVLGSLTLLYTRTGWQMYTQTIFDQLLLPHIAARPAEPRYATIDQAIAAAGLGRGTSFILAFMIACAIGMLVLNYPRTFTIAHPGNAERMPRSLAWLRLASIAAAMAPLFAMYFVPAIPVVYSSVPQTAAADSSNILADGATFSETLSLDDSVELSSIGIGFDAPNIAWIDSSEVTITLVDGAGQTVFATTTTANSLGVGVVPFAAGGAVLTAGEKYTLTITSAHTEGAQAFVQINPDVDRFPTTDNGSTVSGDLVLELKGDPID